MENTKTATLINLLKISQKDFADAIEVSTGTVNDWISGRRNPGKKNIKKICMSFNVSEDWFVSGTGTPFKSEIRKIPKSEFYCDLSYNLSIDEEALIDCYRKLDREDQKKIYMLITETLIKNELKNKSKLCGSQTTEGTNVNIG